MLSPKLEAAVNAADALKGAANTAAINRAFRAVDESHKWPISDRFNVTERAIRRVRREFGEMGFRCEGLEYALSLDNEITLIVNEERWTWVAA